MIRELSAVIFFLLSVFFGIVGMIGLFRSKEPLQMMQTGALCGTTAVFSLFVGLLILSPSPSFLVRFILIIFFFLISSPTSTYIVSRLIWQTGMEESDD
ncbi:MAG: monovalent cation/H(+) antiporter subunit G [Sphaerochaetaceae bacterium]|nr:monovalent cation/H(+) antiporter subunit G [Sphaerochaetaceae bacterium]